MRTGIKRRSRYEELKDLYPKHLDHFKLMCSRAKYFKQDNDFTRDYDGFWKFIVEIGPTIPDGMDHPTVGRKDHTKGYVRGNFEWQSRSDNCREVTIRSKTGSSPSVETREKIRASLKGSTLSAETREKIRQSMLARNRGPR